MFDGRTECIECNASQDFGEPCSAGGSGAAHAGGVHAVFGGAAGENLCAASGGSKERASDSIRRSVDRAGRLSPGGAKEWVENGFGDESGGAGKFVPAGSGRAVPVGGGSVWSPCAGGGVDRNGGRRTARRGKYCKAWGERRLVERGTRRCWWM